MHVPLTKTFHQPVLLEAVLEIFHQLPAGSVFLDATTGAGGHTEALLDVLPESVKVIAVDKDLEAISIAKRNLERYKARISFVHNDFKNQFFQLTGPVAGILIDLGVSSMMLDNPERGFSFSQNGPLDMRMDQSGGETAADLLNRLSYEELRKTLWEYGQERFSSRIARKIVASRKTNPILTTGQLEEIIFRAIPAKHRPSKIHPATRSFMAIRIAVNQELQGLNAALERGVDLLQAGGRMAVISFHSLEDRIVKQTFAGLVRGCICPPRDPVCRCHRQPKVKRRTPITASKEEVKENNRARSARLRAVQRLPAERSDRE
ncbi:MAG: 16S rRNA (cytosine(1402)-N(4))-methyltransferase RsmH [bacterium]